METKIAFIGAGKVAKTLSLYFKEKNFKIVGCFSRNFESAKKMAELTHSIAFVTLHNLISESNMIWITTSDDEIENVVSAIFQLKNIEKKEQKLILHTSGVHSINLLLPLKKQGYSVASAHPLMAFGEDERTVKRMNKVFFATEEEENSVLSVSQFLNQCGNKTFTIEQQNKRLYHTAAVFLSNYLVTLLDVSYAVFAKAGISPEQTHDALQPLIESVFDNMSGKSGAEALTGPIKRGDKKTILNHIEELESKFPQFVDLYKALGKQTSIMIENENLKDIFE